MAVAISAIWVFTTGLLENYLADRSLASELSKAESALQAIEADQNSSENLKEEARTNSDTVSAMSLSLVLGEGGWSAAAAAGGRGGNTKVSTKLSVVARQSRY